MRKPALLLVGLSFGVLLPGQPGPLAQDGVGGQSGLHGQNAGPVRSARALSAAGLGEGTVERGASPVRWRLTASPHEPLRAGQQFIITVQATVGAGWHLYALDEPEDGPSPLEFSVPTGGPVVLVSTGADRPERGRMAGSASAVNYYVGQPRFGLRLRAVAEPGRGASSAGIEVRFQACNERLCLPPRTATLTFPVVMRVR